MQGIADQLAVPVAQRAFGALGPEALRRLFTFLRAYYKDTIPELIEGTLVVVHHIEGKPRTLALGNPSGVAADLARLPRRVEKFTVIEVRSDGQYASWVVNGVDV